MARTTHPNAPSPRRWSGRFLAALAQTGDVDAAARVAKVSPQRAARLCRTSPAFAELCKAARAEAFTALEQAVLARLKAGVPPGGPQHDNRAALQLLALHHAAMAQHSQQPQRLDVVAARMLIERKLEELRQRLLAERASVAELSQ